MLRSIMLIENYDPKYITQHITQHILHAINKLLFNFIAISIKYLYLN